VTVFDEVIDQTSTVRWPVLEAKVFAAPKCLVTVWRLPLGSGEEKVKLDVAVPERVQEMSTTVSGGHEKTPCETVFAIAGDAVTTTRAAAPAPETTRDLNAIERRDMACSRSVADSSTWPANGDLVIAAAAESRLCNALFGARGFGVKCN
jgi:hypothetical protein